MSKEPRSIKRIEQLESLWSWAERAGWLKTVFVTFGVGGLLTGLAAWFQTLPRWIVLTLVFIVASGAVFVVISLVNRIVLLVERKIRDAISDSPLKKRVDALEFQLGSRTLLPDKVETILAAISQTSGRIRLVAVASDSDALMYAKEFHDLLIKAGWEVWGVDEMYDSEMELNGKDIGITLLAPSQEHSMRAYPAAQSLADAIDAVGVTFHYYISLQLNRECCELRIGHRGKPLHD